jgi:enoyl-CoA hydratase
MNYKEISIDLDNTSGVAVLRLERPERHNALNGSIRREMTDAVDRVAAMDEIGALILIGAGDRAFSVGADLKDPESDHSVADFERYINGLDQKQGWYRTLTHYPKAVISATNGYVAGSGLQLALTADVLLGTPTSQFWVPQVGLGLAPHVGSMIKLARIMGQQRMLEMVLTGRRVGAEEALDVGLISAIVEQDELLDHARELAGRIAAQPRLGVRITKAMYFKSLDMAWDDAMTMDDWKAFGMFQTEERQNRHQAFRDRK